MKNYIIIPEFTQGTGNRLFAYFYGKILAKNNDMDFFHPDLAEIKKLDIKSNLHLVKKNNLPTKKLDFITEKLSKKFNFELRNFSKLENFNIWKSHLEYIRSFYKIEEKNTEDLVIHLRSGNAWLDNPNGNSKTLFLGVPEASSFKKLIDSIQFKKLYIVTNTSIEGKYKNWTEEDIVKLKKNLKENGGDGETKETFRKGGEGEYVAWADKKLNKLLADKINNLLNVLNHYEPIWVSNNISDDFNFITTFDKIICSPSTFSWWAAVFSNSKNIYMYKHWKNKFYVSVGKQSKCKNLGVTNYDGWSSWE